LKDFETHAVAFEEILSGKANLDDSDVLVWNDFYFDALPESLTDAVIDRLKKQVKKGKGLFLVCNGVRMVPQLLGIKEKNPETVVSWIGLIKYQIGIRGTNSTMDDGLLSGLQESTDAKGLYAFHDCGNASAYRHIYRRIIWPNDCSISNDCRILAEFGIIITGDMKLIKNQVPEKLVDVTPILREWGMGKGHILGYDFGLTYVWGSEEKWMATENELRFVQNCVNHLANGKKSPKVAILY
jgi:hypothetical protein